MLVTDLKMKNSLNLVPGWISCPQLNRLECHQHPEKCHQHLKMVTIIKSPTLRRRSHNGLFATCYKCKQKYIHFQYFSTNWKLKMVFISLCNELKLNDWKKQVFRLIKNSILNIEVPLNLMTCLLWPQPRYLVKIRKEFSTFVVFVESAVLFFLTGRQKYFSWENSNYFWIDSFSRYYIWRHFCPQKTLSNRLFLF